MDQLTSELDVPDLSGQMSQLEDATAQLQSGAATLHEATGTLQSKMDEFAASYATFDTGLDNALSGAQQVQSGAQNLLDGAKKPGQRHTAACGWHTAAEQRRTAAGRPAERHSRTRSGGCRRAAGSPAAADGRVGDQLGHVQLPDVDALKKQLGAGVGQVFDGSCIGCGRKPPPKAWATL